MDVPQPTAASSHLLSTWNFLFGMRAAGSSLPAGGVHAAAGFSVGCCVAVTKALSDTAQELCH